MSGSESEDNESDSPDENKRMSDDFFPGRGKMDIADNLLDAETLEIMANRHPSVQVIFIGGWHTSILFFSQIPIPSQACV